MVKLKNNIKKCGSKDKKKEARWKYFSLDRNKKNRATDLTDHILEYWDTKLISDLKKRAQKYYTSFAHRVN